MSDSYNKKDLLDILSNLYNNLPAQNYADLREDVLKSADKINKGSNPLTIINILINELTDIIISNINNNIPSVIKNTNILLKNWIKKYNKGLWISDYGNLYGGNYF
ncbi:MAG: bacteriocin immunity protein [Vagococcus fluvialis]